MGKEKSEKSRTPSGSFPVGEWSIFIRNESINIGRLNLAEGSQSDEQYVGSIDFGDNPGFGPIRNGAFSVEIVAIDPETEVIYFKIPAAAVEYNPNTNPPFQFVFIGWACEQNKMCGIARVPKGFGLDPHKFGEDGDDVTWISKGITDPPHKPSR